MSYVVSFEDYVPSPRFPPSTAWTRILIEEAEVSIGPWTLIETQDLDPVDADPTRPQSRNFTTELATLQYGWYRISFADDDGDLEIFSPVQRSGAQPVFATLADVAARVGHELTDAERGQASLSLELAGGLILQEVSKKTEWASTLSPIPAAFRVVSIEMAARMISNPEAVGQLSRTIGNVSWTGTFANAGFYLSEFDCRMVRDAVYGQEAGWVRVETLADDFGVGYMTGSDTFPNEQTGIAGIYDE